MQVCITNSPNMILKSARKKLQNIKLIYLSIVASIVMFFSPGFIQDEPQHESAEKHLKFQCVLPFYQLEE